MNKTLFFSLKFVVLIIFILCFNWTMSGDSHDNVNTFQRNLNLPEVDRGIAVIETKKGEIMAIGVTKKKCQGQR